MSGVIRRPCSTQIASRNPLTPLPIHSASLCARGRCQVERAKIKTNFLKSTHLIDHDLKMILGLEAQSQRAAPPSLSLASPLQQLSTFAHGAPFVCPTLPVTCAA